jgi:hypothetical protein
MRKPLQLVVDPSTGFHVRFRQPAEKTGTKTHFRAGSTDRLRFVSDNSKNEQDVFNMPVHNQLGEVREAR